MEAVIDAAPFFDIAEADAKNMTKNMANTIATIWAETLRQHGINGAALKRCAPAFEHERMETALGL